MDDEDTNAGSEKTTKTDAIDRAEAHITETTRWHQIRAPATRVRLSDEVEEDWQQVPLTNAKFWSDDARAPWACKAREPKSLETYGRMFVGGLDTNDQDEAGDWAGGGYID